VEYDDRLTVATPEGIELDLHLAGLASRMLAGMLDLLLIGTGVVLLAFALILGLGDLGVAILFPLAFALVFFYDVLFEVLGGGRTVGKMAAGLRVVRDDGTPVGLRASAVRNLVRLLDGPATSWLVGSIAILVTKRNQRLGDIAARTVVVRDRVVVAPAASAFVPPAPPAALAGADVSAVTADELATVRTFLSRRWTLDPPARAQLAAQLAQHLRGKVAGAPPGLPDEALLEWVAVAKAARA
jgi:uncharacterized RDD family membrane protein YckC